MKAIFIIDTQWIGHIPTYHTTLVSRLLKLNYKVVSISKKPNLIQESIGLNNNLYCYEYKSESYEATGLFKKYNNCIHWWKTCRKNIEEISRETHLKIDYVFLPGIEVNIVTGLLTGKKLDKIFPYKWWGLYLTPKYLRLSSIKYWIKRLLRKDRFFEAKNCIAVSVLDSGIADRLQMILKSKNVLRMPDFSFLEIDANKNEIEVQVLNKAKNKKIIGLFGEISERKGAETLLKVAEKVSQSHPDWFFIFIGPFNKKNNNLYSFKVLKSYFDKSYNNCYFYLERVKDEKVFNKLIQLTDIMFLAYNKFFHSSNLLTKAAYFKKPVIVTKGYYMAEQVKKYGLGVCIAEKSVDECIHAIEVLLSSEETLNCNCHVYAQDNSVENLDKFLSKVLKATSY